jgi:hypothetical protein
VDSFYFVRVMALDLVKIYNFQIVSHVCCVPWVLESESTNFTEWWSTSLWSCAHGKLHAHFRGTFRFILVLSFSFCVSHSVWPRAKNLYRNFDQHVKLPTLGLACGFILFCQSYWPWLSKYLQFSTYVARSSKSIWPRVMKLHRNVDEYV